MSILKLLVIISEEGYEKDFKKIYDKYNINLKIVTRAKGTASSSLLEYFGLTETNKSVNLAVIPNCSEIDILNEINDILNIKKHGRGIAFTLPLSSSNKFLLDNFKKNDSIKEAVIMNESKYHLIITIVLEGNLELVMTAAKKRGATGGTVIRGRGLGNKEALKLFGFEIEPGREVILNVVEEKIKNVVMEEITKEVGIKTPGKGVCLSIPVDNIIGINKEN